MRSGSRNHNYRRRWTDGSSKYHIELIVSTMFVSMTTVFRQPPPPTPPKFLSGFPTPSLLPNTEWRPHYHGNTVSQGPLPHLLDFPLPQALAEFLPDNNNISVGVGVKQDLDKLQNWRQCAVTFAARVLMRDELKNAGLKRPAGDVLWKEMDKRKEVMMSKWDKWRLTAEQVQYACNDAFVSFPIYRGLMGIPRVC